MSDIFVGRILIVLVIADLASIYMLYRNYKTMLFFEKTNALCLNWDKIHIVDIVKGKEICAYTWFYDKLPKYDKVLFSLKPIKLKYWMSEPKITKLNS